MNNKKSKSILIIGAGIEQQIAIKLAKKMGLKVIAVDNKIEAPGLKFADVGIQTDTSDIDKLVKIGKKYKVDGVMTHGVEIPQIVSKIAQRLGLPHLDPKIAEKATDKSQRIVCFKKAGLPVPRFEVARSWEELKNKASSLGYPLVVKPTDNAGARGVRRVDDTKQLQEAYETALKYSKSKVVLIEDFLNGQEISTESFVYGGKIITTGFGDRNYTRNKEFAPFFVEDGHNVPSLLSEDDYKRVIKAVEKAIKALGINWGVAKGDILLTDNNVYVLEMATRTSGGWFAAGTVPLATGINLLKPLIKISIGEEPTKNDFRVRLHRAACQRYVIPTKTGYFQRFEGVSEARMMPGVKMLFMFNKPKKGTLIHKSTNHSERYGHLIAVGDNIHQAIQRCEDAINKIKIIVNP